MKRRKILTLTLTAVMLLGLDGCSHASLPPDTSPTETEEVLMLQTAAPPGIHENTQASPHTVPEQTEAEEHSEQQILQETALTAEEAAQTAAAEPAVTEPPRTEPPATEPPQPTATEPAATQPRQTAPPETESSDMDPSAEDIPAETAPAETPCETSPAESPPAAEWIDTDTLEAYGREYAAGYGYWGNPNTGFATNAGYYPPSRVTIKTMEDGYQKVRELVDTQYANDVAAGRPVTAIVDGVEMHRKINITIQRTDDPNIFILYCFYGGD